MSKLNKEYLVFLEDPKFLEWVFYPNTELNEYWDSFQKNNPLQKSALDKAVNLCNLLLAKDRRLSASEKYDILVKALDQYKREELTKKPKVIYFNIAKYAAVAIVFFALGYLVFNKSNSFRKQILSENISTPVNNTDGQIIFSDGKSIPIKSKESSVNFTADKIVLDKDTIKAVVEIEENKIAINQVVIPYGKHSFLTLPDGSEVWLNSGSRLLFPSTFKTDKREVFLVGEAYFKVKANKYSPFIVNTNELSVQALGTEFNVSSYVGDNTVNTVLAEGSVRVRRTDKGLFDKDIYLEPNQIASFNKKTQESSVKNVEVSYYTSWRDGYFLFEDEPMSSITKRLERFYNIEIIYDKPQSRAIRIKGKLVLENNHQLVVDNIAATASVKVEKINDNKYIIK